MTAVSERIEVDLESLVRRYQDEVWRYLRYLGATPADAEDLTQENFLALGRAAFEKRSERETAAYLRKVARNQLLMLRRSSGRTVGTVDLAAAE